jgi:hypothetical protein
MKRKARLWLCGFLLGLGLATATKAVAQDAGQSSQPQAATTRAWGTVTAIAGQEITLKTDAGPELTVRVTDSTRLLQLKPGQKDLKDAAPFTLTDLKAGDRVLVRGTVSGDGKSLQAASVIAMKQADIADKQAHERAEWQQHSVGGLVKNVDATMGTISITVSAAGTTKEVAVHTTKDTVLRRYAPNSVKFDDAKPAPLSDVKVGDQLRARGQRSADGAELTADEIVSGTFRSIAGILVSSDSSAGTITVTDLATKQPVTLHVTSDSQLRKLPPTMAQGIAMRLRGAAPGGPPGGNGAQAGSAVAKPPQGGAPGSTATGGNGAGMGPGGSGPGGGVGPGTSPGGNGQARTGDFQQMIARMPAASLSDLLKGEALMIVATEGSPSSPSTVITLLGGVEPILQASSKATTEMILSPWSLGGGGGGEGATP